MENQHKKIKGYGNLSQEKIDRMNILKKFEAELLTHINDVLNVLPEEDVRKRDLAVAKTHFQTGFMWANRSIAQPAEIPHFTIEEKESEK